MLTPFPELVTGTLKFPFTQPSFLTLEMSPHHAHRNFSPVSLGTLCKSLAISAISVLVFFLFYTSFNPPNYQPSDLLPSVNQQWLTSNTTTDPPTNISHIVFGIVGSMNTWKYKRAYSEAWWRPNVTRGYVFLERAPPREFLPWPSSFPPFRVNEDVTKLRAYPRMVKPVQVRIFRTVLETIRQKDKDVRWYVMADDDTVLFLDNLVEVLGKYNHSKYYYLGSISECVKSNLDFSFEMAFGGGGYALSYSLAQALVTKLDDCVERYPHLYASSYMVHSCLADLGVPLTHVKGFHQIDLQGDISGLLSAHPQFPFLSLHHFDTVDPIFPTMNRIESINHLMKAAKFDQSRLLQQTICYHRPKNWSFSVSFGYSIHIYENMIPRSVLWRPLETFKPWSRNARPPMYMFNTRWFNRNPCEVPHVFFFDSVSYAQGGQILTTYVRRFPRGLPSCKFTGKHSADGITKIQVFSSAKTRLPMGGRECCDVLYTSKTKHAKVKFRPCMKDEVIA